MSPLSLFLLTLLPLLSPVQSAMYEPTGNKVWFGLWPQTESPFYLHPKDLNTVFQVPSTSASSINGIPQLNVSVSIFQIAQQIPLPPYNYTTGAGGPAPEYLIEQTFTDAMVFLTVYPETLDAVTTADLNVLANQIRDYQQPPLNRTVFLRWAPEMQGVWNKYGQLPTQYKSVWTTMYQYIKQVAPATAIIWAPNLGSGYPFGQDFSSSPVTAEDRRALDTNNNGELDAGDDPYGPYYPGDAYVDWIGISLYYKGANGAHVTNIPQPQGYCGSVLHGEARGANGRNTPQDWYYTFCQNKPDKACMIAESGAAWSTNITNPPTTQLLYQQAWWQDCITNETYFNIHPRLKMVMAFEYEKLEYDGGIADYRDFRITSNTEMRNAFMADLAQHQDRFQWANYRSLPSAIPTNGRPTNALPGQATETAAPLIIQTARNTKTAFPQLFYTFNSARKAAADTAAAWAVGAATAVAGMGLGGALVRRGVRA